MTSLNCLSDFSTTKKRIEKISNKRDNLKKISYYRIHKKRNTHKFTFLPVDKMSHQESRSKGKNSP